MAFPLNEVEFSFDACTVVYKKDGAIPNLWRAEVRSKNPAQLPVKFDWYSPKIPNIAVAQVVYVRWVKGEPLNYQAN
nr:hypothetical protein Hi04_10k_c5016_00029 [uncultured bacterium]